MLNEVNRTNNNVPNMFNKCVFKIRNKIGRKGKTGKLCALGWFLKLVNKLP